MFKITPYISLDEAEIDLSFIRSPGPGGQNVNKVATAVQLRFNIIQSQSLSEQVRARLITLLGSRLTSQGEIIIKAKRHRTQERNKQDALERLRDIIRIAAILPKKRRETKPTFASKQRRLTKKKHDSKTKALRKNQCRDE